MSDLRYECLSLLNISMKRKKKISPLVESPVLSVLNQEAIPVLVPKNCLTPEELKRLEGALEGTGAETGVAETGEEATGVEVL